MSVPGWPSAGNRWLMHNEDHVYAYAFALVANEDQAFGGKATESSRNIFIAISHRKKCEKKMWAPRVLRATLNEETWHYSRSNRRNSQTSLNFIRPHFLTRVGFCLQRIFSYFSWAKAHCPLLFRKKKRRRRKKHHETLWNVIKWSNVIILHE